jgi:hypothetical protein
MVRPIKTTVTAPVKACDRRVRAPCSPATDGLADGPGSMGINSSFGTLLVRARRQGARFDALVSIGRQSLAIPIAQLQAMAAGLGTPIDDRARFAADGFAEDFFRQLLGARAVISIDHSAYQKADLVHDLNRPIPQDLRRQFDAVIDGGSLEHIFDIRQVLANYMNMVKVGGHLFIMTTANNLCGHGFYQFSPELFYRVFGDANGFAVKDVILIETPLLSVEASRHQRFFRVADPAAVGRRIQLVNRTPVMIFVNAVRIGDDEPFDIPPLQSDYGRKWQSRGVAQAPATAPRFAHLSVASELRRRWRQWRRNRLGNRRFFEALDPTRD